MKQNAFLKDLFRSISRSKARFFSILTIIAIGVGFFAGINATEQDMILSSDKYYKNTNLSDFRMISPLGFRDEDIDRLKKLENIEKVQEGYSKDFLLTSERGNTSIIRLYSYNAEDHLDGNGLNQPIVMEGRLPENPGEIVVEVGENDTAGKIGSEVTLSVPEKEIGKNALKTNTYSVVGTISSPIYISFQRGQTNIGDGSIDFFAYINEDDFNMDRVSDLLIQTEKSKHLTAYTEEYREHVTSIQGILEKFGVEAISRETKEFEGELRDGKNELQVNKEKGERELAEAEQSLLDAELEIKNGEEEVQTYENEYKQQLEDSKVELEEARRTLTIGRENYKESFEIWEQGFNKYEQGINELNQAKERLDALFIQLEQGERELESSKAQLDAGKEQLDILAESQNNLNDLKDELNSNPPATSDEYIKLVDNKNIYPSEIGEYLKGIEYSTEKLPFIIGTIGALIIEIEAEHTEAEEEYKEGLLAYEDGKQQLASGRDEYENGLAQYEEGLAELKAAKIELEKGKQELDNGKGELDRNKRRINEAEVDLVQAEQDLTNELKKGRQELADARKELGEGWITFHREKADALEEIAAAEQEIQDAERNLLEIPKEWFVFSRDANPGYSGYGEDAERIGAVAKVFPLFFFLVAALVCLTTMTRMVEEERNQIGTLKALGYGTFTIASKYLFYALASSLLGALIGLSTGFILFPTAIMNAYGMMYTIPVRLTPYHLDYAVISILIALLTTVTAALFATLQELRSTPAMLMQPRAPKPGKRILLEKIGPLWSRLSFSQKVTFRNLFRYKRRFYMTVIGISGCTALLIAGFGLSDSINDIMGKQFSEIFLSEGQITLDSNAIESDKDIATIFESEENIGAYLTVYNESIEVVHPDSGRLYEVNLKIPENTISIANFFNLQERKSQNKIEIPTNGAVITEKLSNLLSIGIGDTFSYRDTDNMAYEMEVAAVAENYLSHYIYMSPEYAEQITGKVPVYNAVMFNLIATKSIDETAFKEELMTNNSVLNVLFYEEISDIYNDTMKSLDYVVYILIISAAVLAFVVLYNLTNINITERMREIATIKVLGFRNKEVDAYVYRENSILTIFGTILGLILGSILHKYVIATMEIDTMMFGRDVHFSSFLWSIILTIIFSSLVNFFMHFKLKQVNMVESLKSVD